LNHPPNEQIFHQTAKHIIVDGTMFWKRRGVYVALDALTHQLILGAYDIAEGGKELFNFYRTLSDAGVIPKSATIDGNRQQRKYLEKVWPGILIQRCVVHVQRQGLSWCRLHPKRTDAKHLRTLFIDLSTIKSRKDVRHFHHRVELWEQRFGIIIEQTPVHGYVFTDLKSARKMLLKSLPDLFHFISNPAIASSTNALEGYFSRLKEHYRRHRGLSQRHRKSYFLWYFYLVPQ
jgi:hypothetical protein